MSLEIVVLVKQVPDTANISGEVMRPNGTVNRGKLPAVFNPEDRVALELALQLKERFGGRVRAITMGPPKASELLRECLYMGADDVLLITDRKFAGADTLATSYVLSEAIKKIGDYDLVLGGRQAIDGDTAQVGPQTAEKLGLPQVTYAEEVLEAGEGTITIRRRIEGGYEVVKSALPALVTVIKGAAEPRPFRARRLMAKKNARSLPELTRLAKKAEDGPSVDELVAEHKKKGLYIDTWSVADLDVDPERCGLFGSPTKVFKVTSVVLSGGEYEEVPPTEEGIGGLLDQLISDHVFG
jgi:electron transfer flavoprotein beta subunit